MNAARTSPRQKREDTLRSTRRKLILDAAREIFESEGLERATMREIALRAGCTTGAIYPLFKSKEEIYATLLAASLDDLGKCVTTAMDAATPGWRALEAGIRAFAEYYAERRGELALGLYLYNGFGRQGLSSDLNKDLNHRLSVVLGRFAAAYERINVPVKNDPRAMTSTLFSFLIGALMLHHTGRLKPMQNTIDELVETQIATVRNALGGADRRDHS